MKSSPLGGTKLQLAKLTVIVVNELMVLKL